MAALWIANESNRAVNKDSHPWSLPSGLYPDQILVVCLRFLVKCVSEQPNWNLNHCLQEVAVYNKEPSLWNKDGEKSQDQVKFYQTGALFVLSSTSRVGCGINIHSHQEMKWKSSGPEGCFFHTLNRRGRCDSTEGVLGVECQRDRCVSAALTCSSWSGLSDFDLNLF